MGRPSLAEKRKAEILEAFGRCVAKFGLEGSTLEKIAEEAGMRRSILRHYIGNRDELVLALARKVISEFREWTRAALESLPRKGRASKLIEFLLPSTSMGTTEELLIIEGLIGASVEYPEVRQLVFGYVEDFVRMLAAQLKLLAPESTARQRWDVAYGLVCISFNQESLQPLELPDKYLRAARNVATSLVSRLTDP